MSIRSSKSVPRSGGKPGGGPAKTSANSFAMATNSGGSPWSGGRTNCSSAAENAKCPSTRSVPSGSVTQQPDSRASRIPTPSPATGPPTGGAAVLSMCPSSATEMADGIEEAERGSSTSRRTRRPETQPRSEQMLSALDAHKNCRSCARSQSYPRMRSASQATVARRGQ